MGGSMDITVSLAQIKNLEVVSEARFDVECRAWSPWSYMSIRLKKLP